MTLLAAVALSGSTHTFKAGIGQFELDGKPFVIHSGEMHYPRVPRAYWRDRFRKAKALGLNTICTYVFWNQHERTPGKFDFTGNRDLAEYLKIAKEEGLFIILRPGPYICTELDFGGFPAWLLKDRTMKVRENDPKFLKYVDRYFAAVAKVARPYLLENGGPIILTQVENEYGSYGKDHVYMAAVRDLLRKNGFSGELFTSDGPGTDYLKGGTLPDLTAVINFGGGAESSFGDLAKLRPNSPRMIGEYWCGWFDHWGDRHYKTGIPGHVRDIKWCLDNGVSFNLYMFHGGTNFEFMQGSNGGANDFGVDTTSYDYDSPLDESGRVTAKYTAFRELLQSASPTPLPEIPKTPDPIAIPPIKFERSEPLFNHLPTPVMSQHPQTFEDLDQAYGMMLYRSVLPTKGKASLQLDTFGDHVTVFVDGRRQGTIERRLQQHNLDIEVLRAGATLDILVESLSRVNFGHRIPYERKGIEGDVKLNGRPLLGWSHFRLPLESTPKSVKDTRGGYGPRWYAASFNLAKTGDTFLDLGNWNKGFVWVNGHNLGRFWSIGPQRTLYMPGPWLRKGRNEIVVVDDGPGVGTPVIEGLTEPILDNVKPNLNPIHRKEGQTVVVDGLAPLAEATLGDGTSASVVKFPKEVTVRYIALQTHSNQRGTAFATLAELYGLDANGGNLDRSKWSVVYADSEEVDAENGSAANVLDNQPTTIWHTEWSAKETKHPHLLVIDLGKPTAISALRLQPRIDGVNGRLKAISIFGQIEPFQGLLP